MASRSRYERLGEDSRPAPPGTGATRRRRLGGRAASQSEPRYTEGLRPSRPSSRSSTGKRSSRGGGTRIRRGLPVAESAPRPDRLRAPLRREEDKRTCWTRLRQPTRRSSNSPSPPPRSSRRSTSWPMSRARWSCWRPPGASREGAVQGPPGIPPDALHEDPCNGAGDCVRPDRFRPRQNCRSGLRTLAAIGRRGLGGDLG